MYSDKYVKMIGDKRIFYKNKISLPTFSIINKLLLNNGPQEVQCVFILLLTYE